LTPNIKLVVFSVIFAEEALNFDPVVLGFAECSKSSNPNPTGSEYCNRDRQQKP